MEKAIALLKHIQQSGLTDEDRNPGIKKLDEAITETTRVLVGAALANNELMLDVIIQETLHACLCMVGIPGYHPDPHVNLRVAHLATLADLARQFLDAMKK